MAPLRTPLLLLVIVLASVVLAGCGEMNNAVLVSTYSAEDGRLIFEILLAEPNFKKVADRVAPVVVSVVLHVQNKSSQTFEYLYANGAVSNTTDRDADVTLTTTQDVALSVINADDHFRVFACALRDDAATLVASNPVYAASFNAARGRIVGNWGGCSASSGDFVRFKGLSGNIVDGAPRGLPPLIARMGGAYSDWLVFNKWRAPTAWMSNAEVNLCSSDVYTQCGDSAGMSDPHQLEKCTRAVQANYAGDGTSGWDAGIKAAREVSKAGELAACKLVYGGTW